MKKLAFLLALLLPVALFSQVERAIERMRNPEVMVLIEEYADGEFRGTRTVATRIENALIKEGFRVIDFHTFQNIRAREVAQAENNPEKAREFMNRFGAQIIIVGYAEARYTGEVEFYGVKSFRYSGKLDIKILFTDTGELIGSVHLTGRRNAQDKLTAVDLLFKQLAVKATPIVMKKLKTRIEEERKVKRIEIAIYGVSDKFALKFETEIPKKIPSIKFLKYKFFDTNVLVYDAMVVGGESNLRRELANYGNLKVVKFTGRRIVLSTPEKETEAKSAVGTAVLDIIDFSLEPIFPSQYSFYAFNPAGEITIENTSNTTVRNVKVSVIIPDYMKIPSEKVIDKIPPKSKVKVSIPVTLDIKSLLKLSENITSQAQAKVSYVIRGRVTERSLSKPVKIYNRNAITWRRPESVCSFVTPSDEVVKEFTRTTLGNVNITDKALPRNVLNAIIAYNAVRTYGIKYVTDTWKVSGNEILDNIFFPRELLHYKTGDCDDHAVLLSSMLESIGIRTAFILTPDHIFLMFDTGISPKNAYLISLNPKDYIIYDGSVWLPVETTLISKPFVTAWKTGAEEYYKLGGESGIKTVGESETKAGISLKSGIYIIDVHRGWKTFPPVNVELGVKPSSTPNIQLVAQSTKSDIETYKETYKQTVRQTVQALLEKGDEKSMYELARIFTLFDQYDQAEKYLSKYQTASAYNNLGNIYFLKNQPEKAIEYYQKSIELDPNDGGVYLNAGLLYYLNGNPERAQELFAEAISKFESKEEAYRVLGIEDILRELSGVAAEKEEISKKKISKEELRNLIEQAAKVKGKKAKKGYKRKDIFEKGQNVFVFGGRRGADPTQLQAVKSLLYWKF